MSAYKTYIWDDLDVKSKKEALKRPAFESANDIFKICKEIVDTIKEKGDSALISYVQKLDKFDSDVLRVDENLINTAKDRIDSSLKMAIDEAFINIYNFHKAQDCTHVHMETTKGITCMTKTHAIESVGLYVPGGSAPLVSTALMLSIPALIAGCKKIILASPPPINDAILYAASKANIKDIYNMGGAHAIAAMAYGTESVPKVLKIFGPGNQFVTMAKKIVSDDANGAAIDMPAGPSEVLVIADKNANASFIASDLLSQAEHGPDSQVILVSDSNTLIENVKVELDKQLKVLPRADIAKKALSHSALILCKDIATCIEISNTYAPEHLIVHTDNAHEIEDKLLNAGSIFLGALTPESLGDYASGTNHTLPTYGYAKTYSALGTDDYRRRYTVSYANEIGIKNIAKTVMTLANAEGLFAHKNAIDIRYKSLK